MSTHPAIEVQDLSISFPRTQFRARGLKEALLERGTGRVDGEARDFWAVKGVSLVIGKGEVVGIIGPNGSGKSTLLKAITGIYRPDRGKVVTHGRISAMLELGAGFREELTGYENIRLNGAILGFSAKDMDRRAEEIVRFAGLEEFIHQPLRTYSSGMKVRLGFAIASTVEPEILIIDEVLAVGDEEFGRKSLQRIEELASRVTVLIVSHNLALMKRLCPRLVLMARGEVLADGGPDAVASRYFQLLGFSRTLLALEGAFTVARADILGPEGEIGELASGQPATIEVELEVAYDIEESIELVLSFSLGDTVVCGLRCAPVGPLRRGEQLVVRARFDSIDLIDNQYLLKLSGYSNAGAHHYVVGKGWPFRVVRSRPEVGRGTIWAPPARIEVICRAP